MEIIASIWEWILSQCCAINHISSINQRDTFNSNVMKLNQISTSFPFQFRTPYLLGNCNLAAVVIATKCRFSFRRSLWPHIEFGGDELPLKLRGRPSGYAGGKLGLSASSLSLWRWSHIERSWLTLWRLYLVRFTAASQVSSRNSSLASKERTKVNSQWSNHKERKQNRLVKKSNCLSYKLG